MQNVNNYQTTKIWTKEMLLFLKLGHAAKDGMRDRIKEKISIGLGSRNYTKLFVFLRIEYTDKTKNEEAFCGNE